MFHYRSEFETWTNLYFSLQGSNLNMTTTIRLGSPYIDTGGLVEAAEMSIDSSMCGRKRKKE